MHAKTDSEVTSIAPSSPTRSPRRQVYYVQSPSRDSHDGEKTVTTSFHSTPILSPAGSPPHSQSSLGHHSRESSSTRFSGSLKPSGRKVNLGAADASKPHHKNKPPKEIDVIEEEGLLFDDEDSRRGIPRRCYFLVFILGFFVMFFFFSLILWAASKPQKPQITMQSITVGEFTIQAGSDASGVATDMITVNSTVKMLYRNAGTFFGVHVTSSPLDLTYADQIAIASGSIKKFYQSRKKHRTVLIPVTGNKIPLYGSLSGFSSSTGTVTVPVPLTLNFTVRSRAYVLGKIVKPKFYKTIGCALTFDPKKLNTAVSLKNSCTYD